MSSLRIRVYGDPVLRRVSEEVTDLDGKIAMLCEQMIAAMYEAPGIGLAAPQVGVSQRFFVYDFGEGPGVLVNPDIVESDGEWSYNEGCLSVPELAWEIVRPRRIYLKAHDLEGNEVTIEAEDLQARLFQHEMDHLNGKMLLDYLTDEQRREAKGILRQRAMRGSSASSKPPIAVSQKLTFP
ncbi:MAG: peptide deformylase [Acidimicrobiia bacterium]|nr:peptide deformylase [Acidimicrobiia bacterium]MYC57361.1 peptide deformylase [Acidimicrobiia bacterium]MYG94564.1 peptide deformylase [Acidimicrobiia bacterium]MYI31153.1 peptide deformylase [Acidimicrobiia bacterium]